jgi:eukaryotic-like serine/threonine-protein kinase
MDTERSLLFGVVAFQNGAVDADRLAETCTDWAAEPTLPLAELLVDRGFLTLEQRTEVEKVVESELNAHGNDPHATLAAALDGRSVNAIGEVASSRIGFEGRQDVRAVQGGHVVLGKLSPGDQESRDRYTLTHLHAKGGMGRVWLARDASLGRQIALKELRPDQADNSVVCSRFLYEAKITAQLEHPGIVPVYELGEREAPYYTMRFVKGRTLSETIRAFHKKRTTGEANTVEQVELLTTFVAVCHAVAYAHSRGVIHRDLKGQNIVLGNFGEVMVLDWGLAKRIGPSELDNANEAAAPATIGDMAPNGAAAEFSSEQATLATDGAANRENDPRTLAEDLIQQPASVANSGSKARVGGNANHLSDPSSNGGAAFRSGRGSRPETNRESGAGPEGTLQGQLLGTPAYMAPEQAQGRHDLVDERTDVYGLGAILYEILTGRPPFIAPKTSEIIRKVCQEAPIPPRQVVETVTPALEAVCLRALSKVPAKRYASASELAQEIQRHMADEPVTAYAEPWLARTQRWMRRHKRFVTGAAALVCTLAVCLAIGFVLVSKEKKEAETQGKQARQAVQLLTKVADIGFDEQLDPLQKEFLEDALQYYEQFTLRVAHDPAVRLEHGRVYQQMGDIQRKLGKFPESDQAYRKAIEIIEPLAAARQAGLETKRALARSRTLLGNLLVRHGDSKGQADKLYQQAAEVQQSLLSAPTATTADRLHLGQTLKSQGDLLRENGRWTSAGAFYNRAITFLEGAFAADQKHPEVRNDLALAIDARGWIHREIGELKPAEESYRRAMKLLEALVKEFPTVPHHREALARAYNSLALIEKDNGRLADAENHLRLELPLVDRLASDFPDRPEHSRVLARTLMNLGNLMSDLDHGDEAGRALRRAVEVNRVIAARDPQDVQIQLDLAKCHTNLAEVLRKGGNFEQAVASYRSSCAIGEKLVKEHPNQPRYREQLAGNLGDLALALSAVEPTKGEESFRTAIEMYEKLVADHKENFDYRLGLARCFLNFGPILANAKHTDQAEAVYGKALALVESHDARTEMAEVLKLKTGAQINLGSLRSDQNRPDAEEPLLRAMASAERLIAKNLSSNEGEHYRAIAQLDLGDLYLKQKRLPSAEKLLTSAVANFEKLAAKAPNLIDFQSNFGVALATQAKWLDAAGKPADARTVLANAINHQRSAMRLSKNGYAYRLLVGEHQIELAKLNLKLRAYDEGAQLALEVPRTVPSSKRAEGCFDAARTLARLVTLASSDDKLAAADRDRLTRSYLGRTIVLLREAIDISPTLAIEMKTDPDITQLEARPEFKTIMTTLVDLGG